MLVRRVMRFALLFVLLHGCADSPPECEDCFGFLQLKWQLRTTDGNAATCPPNSRVRWQVDGDRDTLHSSACDQVAVPELYDGGRYMLTVDLMTDGVVVATQQLTVQVPILAQTKTVNVEFVVP